MKDSLVRPMTYSSWSKIEKYPMISLSLGTAPQRWVTRGGCWERVVKLKLALLLVCFTCLPALWLILKAHSCKAFYEWGSWGCEICFTLALALLNVWLWTSWLLSQESFSVKDLDIVYTLHRSGPLLGIGYNIDRKAFLNSKPDIRYYNSYDNYKLPHLSHRKMYCAHLLDQETKLG